MTERKYEWGFIGDYSVLGLFNSKANMQLKRRHHFANSLTWLFNSAFAISRKVYKPVFL